MYIRWKKRKYHVNIDVIMFLAIFYLLLFQNFLESKVGFLGNLDEAIAGVIVIIGLDKLIIKRYRSRFGKNEKTILLALLAIGIMGFVGNIKFNYQAMPYAIKDAVLMVKGILPYTLIPLVFSKFRFSDYERILNPQLQVITMVTFVMTMANFVLKIFPNFEVRMGIPTQQFIFTHPTYLASFSIVIVALLSAFYRDNKSNLKYIALMSIVIVTTVRVKVIAFLALYIYMFYVIVVRKRKLNTKDFGALGVIGFVFVIKEAAEYIQSFWWARSAITLGSFKVSYDHFPFGTGFGTYGSWISGEHYSNLYYNYGLDKVVGLQPWYYEYVADTFWPMILGQFGLVGLLAFIMIVIAIYKNIKENDDLYYYFAQMSLLAYLVVLSLGEASFSGPLAVLFLTLIGLLNTNNNNNNERRRG